ncbi:MAG: phosphoribulokinase [Leucothrix sp.]
MSAKHPVVAVTGSSGAGTSYVRDAFVNIFRREKIYAGIVQGDSFHSLTREEFKDGVEDADERGDSLSHFGPKANDFKALQNCFKEYGEQGTTKQRHYLHNKHQVEEHSKRLNMPLSVGDFTPWEDMAEDTELLLYEGLHGMVVDHEQDIDVTHYVDLGIGVVPSVNLEWIQKIHRDHAERGYNEQQVVETILRRMPDYVNYITPQFSLTDMNFQRVPMVDTSNPFVSRDIPSLDESKVVIRFQRPSKYNIDFPFLLDMIEHSFMSRRNTIVVPGNKMSLAIETILTPILEKLVGR